MITILQGDWLDRLRELADGSAQMCCTSPPFYGLRDYGTARWEGGDPQCDHSFSKSGRGEASVKQVTSNGTQQYQYPVECKKCGAKRIDQQLGLERTPQEYVAKLVAGFREVRRALKDDGTLWLNLGDSYNGSGKADCCKAKDLIGIPWSLAFALRDDGWYLRSDIIWHKPNPMPESVTDRPTKAHEYLFLMSKSAKYFYDAEAINEPTSETTAERAKYGWNGKMVFQPDGREIRSQPDPVSEMGDRWCPQFRNKRSVWTITTVSYREAHFATFPPDLIKPCILAGSRPGDTVLDPFLGSGTTGMVALELGRKCIGIELNKAYVKLAQQRTAVTPGLSL
jgi:DNA modification methylase